MSFGKTLRLLRQKAFYTQNELARRLNVSPSTVNRWELDKAQPGIKAMRTIKNFCDENNLDYSIIENKWLDYLREIENDHQQ